MAFLTCFQKQVFERGRLRIKSISDTGILILLNAGEFLHETDTPSIQYSLANLCTLITKYLLLRNVMQNTYTPFSYSW